MLTHSWDITPAEAIGIQKQLAGKVQLRDLRRPVRTVAGADCAFVDGGRRIIAVAVLCEAESMQVIAQASSEMPCRFPYVPGLLSFREAPAILAALERLPQRGDLLMIDGQGIAHPRGLGIASHVGLLLDSPTIGVAKSRLCGRHEEPLVARGSRADLLLDGQVVGVVLRTRANVRCLYVSVGHEVTLEQAVRWTLDCCRGYRLPEPTRQAHLRVTGLKRQFCK